MCKDDLSGLVDFLSDQIKNGYTIVTHNGLGFDFDVLAEESGRLDDCRKLAIGHVDIMFHVSCYKGFCVGLDAAGKAIGINKSDGVIGAEAPQLWKDGKCGTVLKYMGQDCRITLDVAEKSEQLPSFRWITQRGTVGDLDLPKGWLTVQDASNFVYSIPVNWRLFALLRANPVNPVIVGRFCVTRASQDGGQVHVIGPICDLARNPECRLSKKYASAAW